jgi:hypothetical protein
MKRYGRSNPTNSSPDNPNTFGVHVLMTRIMEKISGLRLTHGVITRRDEREAERGFYLLANRENCSAALSGSFN